MYVPIILIFYFFIIRPQRQQQKKIKEMLANLKKNDEVITTSGIHGTVAIVKEKTVFYAWMKVAALSLTVNPLLR